MGRIQIISIGAVGLVLILIGRLFQLTVFQYSRFVQAAEAQQVTEQFITPRRGDIYLTDQASGEPVVVAQTVERFALGVTPRDVKEPEAYAKYLAKRFNLDEAKLIEEFGKKRAYMPFLVRNLTKEEVQVIEGEVNDLEKSLNPKARKVSLSLDSRRGSQLYFQGGLYFVRQYVRAYPEGKLAPHVLGFVDDQGEGQYGFEARYQDALAGIAGSQFFERDSIGSLLSAASEKTSQDGVSYVLTIDRNVQRQVEDKLLAMVAASEAVSGSAIVLDAQTGAVVAMASAPDFTPADFRSVPSEEQGRFTNRAISDAYEPGSVAKPLAVAAAVDKKVISPTEPLGIFGAAIRVDGFEVNTAERKAFGLETAADVLANSDNVAMVSIANALGNESLFSYYQRFGFGEKTGIDLQGEVGGTLRPLREWRGAITRATASFGQGMTATPLQLAAAFAPLANGGYGVTPHIVAETRRPDGSVVETQATRTANQLLSSDTVSNLQRMMRYTIDKTHKNAIIPRYAMGGKTGTAQIVEDGEYKEGLYNHTYVGVGPFPDSRFVIVTRIERPNTEKVGIYAQSTAMPLYKDIAQFLLSYYQVAPQQ